jgi:glutamate-1-semialdehyde 2,1-aminomutase
MEVCRSERPLPGFLESVRRLASENNAVLVFDECTSGFRETFGGLHRKYGIDPDMAVFGKALGNGYAITAVIGRRDVMESAQQSFISSTFWTERIGPSAALETLRIMEREKTWETITQIGNDVCQRWRHLASDFGIPLSITGLPALCGFKIESEHSLKYKTLITQEMLAKGFLASTSLYVCIAHSAKVVDSYFDALQPVFILIKQCEDGRDPDKLLKSPVCHSGFARLT